MLGLQLRLFTFVNAYHPICLLTSMSSKPKLTDESLIDLLEKYRRSFTGQSRPLLTAEETALRKANDLVMKPLESPTRNYRRRKRAFTILSDIKNCISYDVFVLCALATNVSTQAW
jgi:hypothetical protein